MNDSALQTMSYPVLVDGITSCICFFSVSPLFRSPEASPLIEPHTGSRF